MKKPTRFYSNKQEQSIAKAINGKQTVNSGATKFSKGDVKTNSFLIEAKTCVEPKKSFTLKKDWFEKNREEAFAMGKEYSVIAFNFGPDEPNHYVIDEKLFKTLVKFIEGDFKNGI